MIHKLDLKFGTATGKEKTEIVTTPITVFVGPNNSGKSKILNEIYSYCNNGQVDQSFVIIEKAEIDVFSSAEAEAEILRNTRKPSMNEQVAIEDVIIGNYGNRQQVNRIQLLEAMTRRDQPHYSSWFSQWYLRHKTLLLNGQTRMQLIIEQQGGDLLMPPMNSIAAIFREDEKRAKLRRIIHDAFGFYLVIDPTNLGYLRIKLSKDNPTHEIERSLTDETIKFHSKAIDISLMSDGVKAFTGITLELIAGDPKIVLIDEPEAFLHPSLAAILGKEVAEIAASEHKKVFISTHSPNFIMGCLQTGIPLNITRLTYLKEEATARVLPNDKLSVLMKDPLLRSTGVLAGLFYESVVVTESDSDRAFYQEINERLLKHKNEWGIKNCLFINAQNKQTIHQIIRPLRELGIPAAAIVDIDIIKEGGTVWSSFLDGGYIPEITKQALNQSRSLMKAKFDTLNIDMKRNNGIDQLDPQNKMAAEDLFNQIAEYGLFSLRKGELESWLPQIGATGHGPKWLIEVFERMGENLEAPDYLLPAEDDVWKFIYSIKVWFDNPNRKGIPS